MAENKRQNAGLVISEDVIEKIAQSAALEIKGVAGLITGQNNFVSFPGKRINKAVKISVAEQETFIDIHLKLFYGEQMQNVCEQVQQRVKTNVQNMTGRIVVRVNVFVDDIEFDKPSQD